MIGSDQKFLYGTIITPAYDLEVKITDLEIYVKTLHQLLRSFSFLSPSVDLHLV